MFNPLNGSVLNGSSHGVWAERAVGTADATTSAFIQRKVPGKGVATGQASTESVGVRVRLVFSTSVAEAHQTADSVRLADFDGSISAEAIGVASAPILRWSKAVAEVSAALTPPIPWRGAYTDSSVVSEAECILPNDDIVVYAIVSVRRSPAVGSIYVHAWGVTELRTTLISNSGFSLSIADTWGIANSPLGRGLIEIDAESTGSDLFVTHDFKGKLEASAEATTDASRVRAYDTAQPGVANSNSEPNITRDGVTYAYMAGIAVTESSETCDALRVRTQESADANTSAQTHLEPYYKLDHSGICVAQAEAEGELGRTYKAQWYRKGQGPIQADGTVELVPIIYRWVYIKGDSDSVAETGAVGIHYRWVGAEGGATAVAEQTTADNFVRRGFWAEGEAAAEVVEEATKNAYTQAAVSGSAETIMNADVFGWSYLAGKITGEAQTTLDGVIHYVAQEITGSTTAVAESTSNGLHIHKVETIGYTNTAETSSMFYLNIGDLGPTSRTYQIKAEDRVYNIGPTTREYRI